MDTSRMVAGFTNSSRVRPMLIGKFQEYLSDKDVTFKVEAFLTKKKNKTRIKKTFTVTENGIN